MEVIATSDLHGQLPYIEGSADLFIIAGDISPLRIQFNEPLMENWLFSVFSQWVKGLSYKDNNSKCILIAGNHDHFFEVWDNETKDKLIEMTDNRLVYLENSEYIYKDNNSKEYKIFGVPYCRELRGWPFCKPDNKLYELYGYIPKGCDILVTHDAPDIGNGGLATELIPSRDFGNKVLADAIDFTTPKHVIFGHIHSSPLKNHFYEHKASNGDIVKICNVSYLNEKYKVATKPLNFNI